MRLHLVGKLFCKYYLLHHLNMGIAADKMKLTSLQRFIAAVLFTLPIQALAQIVALDQGESLNEKRSGWLPYAFSTDSLDTAIGAGWFSAGTLQPQASLFATGFVTANDSALFSGALNNFSFGEKSRLFADAYLQVNRFTDQRFYAGPTVGDEARPGSNDSDEDSYVTGSSDQLTLETNFKYRLPIGSLRDDPLAVYQLSHGLVESGPAGGGHWNPLENGQTTLGVKAFYNNRDLSDLVINQLGNAPADVELTAKTNGINFWLEHDNTDFPRNPSRGSRQVVNVSRDFGWFDSDDSWTSVELSLSKYFDLGTSAWFRQQVLALNYWTSVNTDWDENTDGTIEHNPPPGYGSELGGYDRLRGYASQRFNDKAAVHYAAELRLIPQLQPLHDLPILNYFQIDWWQIVPFVEAGRVSDKYNSDLYFEDLKWDAGVGIRLMTFRSVVRLDFAYGEEGTSVYAMISHPFSRMGK